MRIDGGKDAEFFVEMPLSREVTVRKYSFLVMVWAWSHLTGVNDDRSVFMPSLLVKAADGSKKQVRMGRVNQGMGVHVRDNAPGFGSFDWSMGAAVGRIPPGQYALSLLLNVKAGKSVLYDGIRLFLIEKAGDVPEPL